MLCPQEPAVEALKIRVLVLYLQGYRLFGGLYWLWLTRFDCDKLGGGERCNICSKPVYHEEKVRVYGDVFHTTCFKCNSCGVYLNLQTFHRLDQVYHILLLFVICLLLLLFVVLYILFQAIVLL